MPNGNEAATRAERVRKRRAERARNRKGGAGKADSQPTNIDTAPILTRGQRFDMPHRKRKDTRVRKRMDIALKTPGAEVQLPALPVIRLSSRILSGILIAGLIFALYNLWNLPDYMVSVAQIDGLQYRSEQQINLVLRLDETPVVTLDPVEMQQNLVDAFPEFLSVFVEIAYPNQVLVSIVERVPVLAWQHANGVVWVDQDGISFPAHNSEVDLPVISAPGFAPGLDDAPDSHLRDPFLAKQLIPPEMVGAVLKLTAHAPEKTVFILDPVRGLGWEDERGWAVFFGNDITDIESKLKVYNALVKDFKNRGITPALVSLEHLHSPYFRMDR
jgi:hypothetical protein